MKKIIFATGNEDKMKEIRRILADPSLEILSLKDAGIHADIDENGKSFEENAMIKAEAISKMTGEIVLADDSGLEIDYLNKEPGIYSARYAGENVTYADNNKKLLDVMADVPEEKRGAAFITAIAMILPDGQELTCQGLVRGKIAFDYCGEGGFGYDPLFIHEETGHCYGDMTKEEKNRISHRAAAVAEAKELLLNS